MKPSDALVGRNLRALREDRRLSLAELAELTGVSKSALWQIEAGESSPTITTLWKIANGLHVPFSAFLQRPEKTVAVTGFRDRKPLDAGMAGYRLYPLVPFDPEQTFEVYYVEIDPGIVFEAEPHLGNTEEHVFLTRGEIEIRVEGESHALSAEQCLTFAAGVPHRYENPGAEMAAAVMLISYVSKS